MIATLRAAALLLNSVLAGLVVIMLAAVAARGPISDPAATGFLALWAGASLAVGLLGFTRRRAAQPVTLGPGAEIIPLPRRKENPNDHDIRRKLFDGV